MDQIKIGKFIAETRKERNMTQLDLARKLGVTDRAVSKWENGRGMPDISLIKPLCDELSVSVNELFCGERIREENLTQKAEENIVNTLKYSKKKIKKVTVFFISAIATVMSVIILLATLFAVDINRMRNNKPVLFSTWGFSYAPPIDLSEEKIQLAIKDYLQSFIEAKGTVILTTHDEEELSICSRLYVMGAGTLHTVPSTLRGQALLNAIDSYN